MVSEIEIILLLQGLKNFTMDISLPGISKMSYYSSKITPVSMKRKTMETTPLDKGKAPMGDTPTPTIQLMMNCIIWNARVPIIQSLRDTASS